MKSSRYIAAIITAAMTAASLLALNTTAAFASEDDTTEELSGDIGITTQLGDVNFDKSVSISDAVQLQRFLTGESRILGNWRNADLCEDGVIDIFDLAVLKKQLMGQKPRSGGSLRVNVVDMMSGEPLEGAKISVLGLYDCYCYDVAEWNYDSAEDKLISGLPLDSMYTYMIGLSELPDGYGTELREWDQQMFFDFDGSTDKEITLRVAANDDERNVRISLYDWSMGRSFPYYGLINLTDREGNPYYPTMHTEDIVLPDGEYHADITLLDYPVQLVFPDSDFAKEINELYPDVVFTDKSEGIDFTVKDGKADGELRFDMGPVKDMSNYINIRCIDETTGEPVEGAEISVIEAPDTYARKVKTCVSDSCGIITIDGLHHTGFPAYKIQVDRAPEGYSGSCEEFFHCGYVYGYEMSVTCCFTPDTEKNLVSADILRWEDKSVFNDAASFEVWKVDPEDSLRSEKLLDSVGAGEKFALEDGDYFAVLDSDELKEKNYSGIPFYTKNGKQLTKDLSLKEFMADTAMIQFTVTDGAPDRDLVFYVKEYEPADDEDDADLSEFEDPEAFAMLIESLLD